MTHRGVDIESVLREEGMIARATLVVANGAGPSKKIGAKMFVGASGRLLGGVTIGGCVDARVIEAAEQVIATGSRTVVSIDLDDDDATEIGLTCGGSVEVMVERMVSGAANHVNAAVRDALSSGRISVVATAMDGEEGQMFVDATGIRIGSVGNPMLDDRVASSVGALMISGASQVEVIDGRRFFLDRYAPPLTIVIVGAGQIAMSLARFARELEMRIIVVDGRDRFATRERFPDADEIHVGMPSEILARLEPSADCAVVLVAHDYKYELPAIRLLLRSEVGYLGMLGSRKRGAAIREMLAAEGFTSGELARMHSPIGLRIGGTGPAEVALSIIAEIVAHRNSVSSDTAARV